MDNLLHHLVVMKNTERHLLGRGLYLMNMYNGSILRGGSAASMESQGTNADRLYQMNSKSNYSKDNPAGSKAVGKEMAKMLEEMKVPL